MDAILKLFEQKKKAANVVLVLDTSGSMNDDRKIQNAREGAKQLVNLLSARRPPLAGAIQCDHCNWATTDVAYRTSRGRTATRTIDSLFASRRHCACTTPLMRPTSICCNSRSISRDRILVGGGFDRRR